jgi:hypothetical protein
MRALATSTIDYDKPRPSLKTIQTILKILLRYLTFTYADFEKEYGEHDRLVMQKQLEQLDDDVLMREEFYEPRWFGFAVVQHIATNWLRLALTKGCRSWDTVLLCHTALLLQSACGARVGDVMMQGIFGPHCCVCWRDVIIRLGDTDGTPTIDGVRMEVKMRFRKGNK